MKPPVLGTKCGLLESYLCCADAVSLSDFASEVRSDFIILFLPLAFGDDIFYFLAEFFHLCYFR